jgi:hypothetical protein
MSFVNLPPQLSVMFKDLSERILKLENKPRMFVTVYPIQVSPPSVTGLISGDITDPRVGQLWLNTTSNQLRTVDANGVARTITWS